MGRLTRIYTDQPLTVGHSFTLAGTSAHHLLHVLRVKTGTPVTLFNGDGHDYPSMIIGSAKRSVDMQVLDKISGLHSGPLRLTLAQCISKNQHMDMAIQKAVELGVFEIIPVVSERSQQSRSSRSVENKLAHWRGVIVSACEQCGRADLPALKATADIDETIERARSKGAQTYFLDPLSEETLPNKLNASSVVFLVGPEGGLSEQEIENARNSGAIGIRLGPRILRTETAAISILSIAQFLWGDL